MTNDSLRAGFTRATLRQGAVLLCLIGAGSVFAAGPSADVVGSWKLVSHTVSMGGTAFDSQAALHKQRPCAAKIRYNVKADGTYRLDASASDCDEKYRKAQERLYAQTKWKLEGGRITTSATNFAGGQSYAVTVAGDRMTWVGTEGQGTMVFQR